MSTDPSRTAVIVATARSPIGRAGKGSLRDLRPDDLAATIVRAALDQVPELDPTQIDDLYLGCGLPGGEQGFNMGRVVATLLGLDTLPAATVTRYCASSLQTTRMAFHAIAAGEGTSSSPPGSSASPGSPGAVPTDCPPRPRHSSGAAGRTPGSPRPRPGRPPVPRPGPSPGPIPGSTGNCPTST